MAGGAACLGVGRYLVLAVAVLGHQRLAGFLNIPEDVVFGQLWRLVPEHRVRLHGQLIPRQVCRPQIDGLAQVTQRVVQRLVGQAVHQVHVEIVETGRARHVGGPNRFVAIMDAPQCLQLGWLEALHADRKTVDTGLPVGLELVLLEGARVGFEGDLDVWRERNTLLYATQ
ncbi:hypothetical protein D9M71_559080 [compost metagenome]